MDKQTIPNGIFMDEYKVMEGCEERMNELTRHGYDTDLAFFMPKDFRDRFIAIARTLKAMLDSTNMGQKFGFRKNNKSERLIIELKTIAQALCHLINSTSFDQGHYFEFDEVEMDIKLRRNK